MSECTGTSATGSRGWRQKLLVGSGVVAPFVGVARGSAGGDSSLAGMSLEETIMTFLRKGQGHGIGMITVAVFGEGEAGQRRLFGEARVIRAKSNMAVVYNVVTIVEEHRFRRCFPAGITTVAFIVDVLYLVG